MAGTRTDELVDELAVVINRYVWSVYGPHAAATRVLVQPAVADALRAADVVAELDRAHQPRRWSDDSSTVVCDTCQRAYPCPTRDALDGRLT